MHPVFADSYGGGGWLAGWIVIWVVWVIAAWRVFEKAGRPGWAAIIPIYNAYVILKIAGKPGWWLLLYLIPIVNVVVAIVVAIALARAFGHGAGFGVGLLLLSIIFWCILGFDGSRYLGGGGERTAPQPA